MGSLSQLGIFNMGVVSQAAPSGFLLDTYPNAAAGYSLRQLRTGVTNVVRVRRDSDNTEQDFTPIEITDGTLTTFVGAGDGFVAKLYDQSGNADDATQTVLGSQLRLVTSGVVNTDTYNGLPIMRPVSALSYMDTPLLGNLTNWMFTVATTDNTTSLQILLQGDNGSNEYLYTSDEGSDITSVSQGVAVNNQWINGVTFSPVTRGDVYDAFKNNALSSVDFSNPNWTSVIIGYPQNTSIISCFPMQELVLYQSSQSSNRAAIETEINNYYSIY
ncbi:MAG: hypothetical protein Unbinned4388contig1000_82 [Prokaryotic dsDNA virus sp.]|nr:MAG: hypothetical protein Unbinned4388contig1000_82 [Prokaryotic dsDNA virus sp.]|tara:strand:+ start:10854 stop:11672 length:819 start_codon:yes stop_codon:yes gene_type:complete